MFIRFSMSLIILLMFSNCAWGANKSHAIIKGWNPGSYGNYPGLPQQGSLPIWVRIDFDQKPTENFINQFFVSLLEPLGSVEFLA